MTAGEQAHGGTLVAADLARRGVRTLFALTGGHIYPILSELAEKDIRLIDMRHEAALVHAADAYARVSGKVGVAAVTAGPGVANALAGLATAYHSCSPVLVLGGSSPLTDLDRGAVQEADQLAMVSGVTKWARRVHDPNRLPDYIDMAFREATRGRPGPVFLDVPDDMLRTPVVSADLGKNPSRCDPPSPSAASIEAAFQLLSEATRPLIVTGGGARWSEGSAPALRRLARLSGIPVLGKALGRGLVPEDMESGFPYDYARIAVPEADVVLILGARLNWMLCCGGLPRFDPATKVIQVDIHTEELGLNRDLELAIAGDAGAAAVALGDLFEASSKQPKDRKWLIDILRQRESSLEAVGRADSGPVHQLRIAREFYRYMPKDAIVVGDGANILNYGKACLRVHHPGSWLDHSPLGAMGIGVPFAIGARAASEDMARATGSQPHPVWVLSGDGSLGFFIMELHTAARHKLPFTLVVANDGGWGADRNSQRVQFGRNFGADFGHASYDGVARALDCWGALVSSPEELAGAFTAAIDQNRPAVINVLTDAAGGAERRGNPLLEFQLERSLERFQPFRASRDGR